MPELEEVFEQTFGPDSLVEGNPVKHIDVVIGMLDELGLLELREVVDAAQQKLDEREVEELARARQTVKELAEKLNVSTEQLLSAGAVAMNVQRGNGKSKPGQTSPTPMLKGYRNPENPDQTWPGKGRAPNWFKTAISNGVSKESMRI